MRKDAGRSREYFLTVSLSHFLTPQMTIREALRFGSKELKMHRCRGADAVRESEALLCAASGLSRERLFYGPGLPLTAPALRRFRTAISRRRRHEPLAYVLGTAWFMGREFESGPSALIPRPATEHVVEAAVAAARERRAALVVDIGAGSGCIAVSAALADASLRIVATDASAGALALARRNAVRHGVRSRISFRKGDLAEPARAAMSAAGGPVVVVANLPYIPTRDMRGLPPDVRREPSTALDGGADGLVLYRQLLDQLAVAHPSPLTIVCEILPRQYRSLRTAVFNKIPGARAGKIVNYAGVCVGLRADV